MVLGLKAVEKTWSLGPHSEQEAAVLGLPHDTSRAEAEPPNATSPTVMSGWSSAVTVPLPSTEVVEEAVPATCRGGDEQ